MRVLTAIWVITILFLPSSIRQGGLIPWSIQAGAPGNVNIVNITPGEVVQGSVEIRGNTVISNFQSYEVDFAYSGQDFQTWFPVHQSSNPVEDGLLAVWDTSTITDGNYDLRLWINLTDGTHVEAIVNGLRVRNYTPIETATPLPTTPPPPLETPVPENISTTSTPELTPTARVTPTIPGPTALPTNSLEISRSQVASTFGWGAAATAGAFSILGVYLGIRTWFHHRYRE